MPALPVISRNLTRPSAWASGIAFGRRPSRSSRQKVSSNGTLSPSSQPKDAASPTSLRKTIRWSVNSETKATSMPSSSLATSSARPTGSGVRSEATSERAVSREVALSCLTTTTSLLSVPRLLPPTQRDGRASCPVGRVVLLECATIVSQIVRRFKDYHCRHRFLLFVRLPGRSVLRSPLAGSCIVCAHGIRSVALSPSRRISIQHYTLWRWIDMRDTVSCSALSTTDNKPTKQRGCCMERPLFWVVLLQSASSLAQQKLCGEYLVVGRMGHDHLEVAQCCSHERSNLLCEILNRRTGELVGRRHELRDTLLGLFGVKLFFVEGLLADHLIIRLFLTGPGVFFVLVGHVSPFAIPRTPYATTPSVYPPETLPHRGGSALSSSCALMGTSYNPRVSGIDRRNTPRIMRGWTIGHPGHEDALRRSRGGLEC